MTTRAVEVVFWIGAIVNTLLTVRMIRDVNAHLPKEQRWKYVQWWTFLEDIIFWEQHRRWYPESRLRLVLWLMALFWAPFAVMFLRQFWK